MTARRARYPRGSLLPHFVCAKVPASPGALRRASAAVTGGLWRAMFECSPRPPVAVGRGERGAGGRGQEGGARRVRGALPLVLASLTLLARPQGGTEMEAAGTGQLGRGPVPPSAS